MDDFLDYENPDYEYENPEPYSELLIAKNPNTKASKAMRKAARLRKQGYSKSEALVEGWKQVGGRSNPEFEPSALLLVVVVVGFGLGIHRLITGEWLWKKWGLGGRQSEDARRLAMARSQRAAWMAKQQEQQSYGSKIPVTQARNFQEESVDLLVP